MEEFLSEVSDFETYASGIACIFYADRKNEIAGGGFLVTPRYLLTCSHVVADALKLTGEARENGLSQTVELEFRRVLETEGRPFRGEVVFWRSPSLRDDIALLRLDEQPSVSVQPTFLPSERLQQGQLCRAFGWGIPEGSWAEGYELCGSRSNSIYQFEQRKPGDYKIQKGFSGCPLWTKGSNRLAGMITTAEWKKDVSAAFVICRHVLRDVLDMRLLVDILEPHEEALAPLFNSAYRVCRPQHATEDSFPKTVREKSEKLQYFQRSAGLKYTRLEEFAAFFKRDDFPNGRAWEKLTEWLRSRSIDPQELRDLVWQRRQERDQISQNKGEFYFLVAISPNPQQDLQGRDTYNLKGWAIENYDRKTRQGYIAKSGQGCESFEIDGPLTEEEVRKNIPLLLEKGDIADDAIVEFFLPDELMNKGVEFWKADKETGYPTWLCQDSHVYVRSLERVEKNRRKWREKWQKRWDALIEASERLSLCHAFVVMEASVRMLHKKELTEASGWRLSSVVRGAVPDRLMLALRVDGIPTAIWLRRLPQVDPPAQCCDEIKSILGNCLGSLFENIKKKRCEAINRTLEERGDAFEDYIDDPEKCDWTGRHISFLWDDPNLIPPPYV